MVGDTDVIFVSTSVGAGHNQAAAAIIAELAGRHPHVRAEFIDALEFVPGWFRMTYAGLYTLSVTRFPWAYGWGYRLLNRPKPARRALGERLRLFEERLISWRLRRHVLDRRPGLLVATHYLAAPALSWLVRRSGGRLRLWMVMTDYEAHRFWYSENVERYFVGDERVRGEVLAWDIPPERVTVSGVPVHPKWTADLDADRIRRDWHLPADAPIVLLSAGAYFTVGPVEQIARGILDTTRAHVVVLAGANKRLLARLANFAEHGRRLTAVAFTDRVNELAHVASLMVTKAGGLTTSECIAKGVPMVLTKPVPGQETGNTEMLGSEGAAMVAPTTAEVIEAVRYLMDRPEALEALRSNARRLYKPGTQTIARHVAEALKD